MTDDSLLYCQGLARVEGVGVRGAHRLIERFGSPQAVYCVSLTELEGCGLRAPVVQAIFVKVLAEYAVAMVGRRRPTAYGASVAHRLAADLAERRLTIVSGLARGIDSACHRGALEAKGRTVAVLGSGLDVLYPRENKSLADRIVATGAVISEFPLGTSPAPKSFRATPRS
jgi:predicted Rossmann fold nucleotide-binding protein DprA/Smf involved in DNA uptake